MTAEINVGGMESLADAAADEQRIASAAKSRLQRRNKLSAISSILRRPEQGSYGSVRMTAFWRDAQEPKADS